MKPGSALANADKRITECLASMSREERFRCLLWVAKTLAGRWEWNKRDRLVSWTAMLWRLKQRGRSFGCE